MDSAPLPPHERTWRHPSEIAGPPIDVEQSRHGRAVALTSGTVAVALVAALIITLTPGSARTTTTAISDTTVPRTALLSDAAVSAVSAAESIRKSNLSGATAIPSAVADVPAAVFRSSSAAGSTHRAVLPDLDDRVTVLTEHVAYVVPWRDVARLDLSESAVVVSDAGSVVARIEDGRLIVSRDILVGASVDLD